MPASPSFPSGLAVLGPPASDPPAAALRATHARHPTEACAEAVVSSIRSFSTLGGHRFWRSVKIRRSGRPRTPRGDVFANFAPPMHPPRSTACPRPFPRPNRGVRAPRRKPARAALLPKFLFVRPFDGRSAAARVDHFARARDVDHVGQASPRRPADQRTERVWARNQAKVRCDVRAPHHPRMPN